jgi:flagellar biosynthesis protein FliR
MTYAVGVAGSIVVVAAGVVVGSMVDVTVDVLVGSGTVVSVAAGLVSVELVHPHTRIAQTNTNTILNEIIFFVLWPPLQFSYAFLSRIGAMMDVKSTTSASTE